MGLGLHIIAIAWGLSAQVDTRDDCHRWISKVSSGQDLSSAELTQRNAVFAGSIAKHRRALWSAFATTPLFASALVYRMAEVRSSAYALKSTLKRCAIDQEVSEERQIGLAREFLSKANQFIGRYIRWKEMQPLGQEFMREKLALEQMVLDLNLSNMFFERMLFRRFIEARKNGEKIVFTSLENMDGLESERRGTRLPVVNVDWTVSEMRQFEETHRKALAGFQLNLDALVAANQALVFHIAKKYSSRLEGRALEFADLVAFGNQGLMTAASYYDQELGTAFVTYAYNWIEQRIDRSIITEGSFIRIPAHLKPQDVPIKQPSSLSARVLSPTGSVTTFDHFISSANSISGYSGVRSSEDANLKRSWIRAIASKLRLNAKEFVQRSDVVRGAKVGHRYAVDVLQLYFTSKDEIVPESKGKVKQHRKKAKGISYDAIGDMFGMTRENVRLILNWTILQVRLFKYLNDHKDVDPQDRILLKLIFGKFRSKDIKIHGATDIAKQFIKFHLEKTKANRLQKARVIENRDELARYVLDLYNKYKELAEAYTPFPELLEGE